MNAPVPQYPKSTLIKEIKMDRFRLHKGDGDMWPLTWAADNSIYAAAGDNTGSPMNLWRIFGEFPQDWNRWELNMEIVNKMPVDPAVYSQIPGVTPGCGIKPAGILSIKGILYFAVEAMNYGDNPSFNRQKNINAWIMTSEDYGKTWNVGATPIDFFTGRLASPHFLQFGRDFEGARDEFVYAYFTAGDDGCSYWTNGDYTLLGRVHKEKILLREDWEFYTGNDNSGNPTWSKNDTLAVPVFRYPLMTCENHAAYNKGIQRYILGNSSFIDENGNPRSYYQNYPYSVYPSQLTLFEAPEPWGPWSLFYKDDNWGTYGDYQPNFPTKWISEDGKTMYMVSAGAYDDYNFTVQKMTLVLDCGE